MHLVLQRICDMGIIPLVSPALGVEPVSCAKVLSEALKKVPLPIVLLPFRSQADEEAIRRVKADYPELLVGCVGITSIAKASQAKAAGAEYIITTGFNPRVVSWCLEQELVVLPGCSSASDVEAAQELGLSAMAFFPADHRGRLETLQSLCAFYPNMRFVPVGQMDMPLVKKYLACPSVLACAAGFCVDEACLTKGDSIALAANIEKAVQDMLDMQLHHVGVYPEDDKEESVQGLVQEFTALTHYGQTDVGQGIFVGEGIEVLKSTSDWKGHLAYAVPNVERTCAHLLLRGVEVDFSTARINDEGRCFFVYMKKALGGFGIHLRLRKP